ncbi:hypothetical protein [Agriterribacter sp.]|uniref:hypothetical protein n=1 Tax=Agriterribacter sp. TaxID=2821509 RepID=UPI002CFE7088|nr:hypothetical protein [Agriterribacter sp.]HRP54991.1 hypothetical protein [Agriterribacter sp.]
MHLFFRICSRSLITCFFFLPVTVGVSQSIQVPAPLRAYIQSINSQPLGNYKPVTRLEQLSDTLFHLQMDWVLKDTLKQNDWQLQIIPAFQPDFHWAPHLTPTPDHIINQHVFRTPAMLVTKGRLQLAVIPDPDILSKNQGPDWYMDLDAPKNRLTLGMSLADVPEHTAFVRAPGGVYPPGTFRFGCYLMIHKAPDKTVADPWRPILSFFWKNWGEKAWDDIKVTAPLDLDLQCKRAYDWAFVNWKPTVWQEFELNGQTVGAPQFIVNVTQSPNYPGEVDEREFRSIWNQAWFNSLRSAAGLYRYARRHQVPAWLEYARKTKELALAFPQTRGFFPGLIGTEMEKVLIDGKYYNRSKGWSTRFFGNSDRNPYFRDARLAPYHILDMSFTANQMLIWYTDLEKDERLLNYAITYADALLGIQDKTGFFPAWLDLKTLQPLAHLNRSPETSLSVSFLLRLYGIVKEEKYKKAALKALSAVIQHNLLTGQWEDFETYWSCSPFGRDSLEGKKIIRNNMYKQNNFCMSWTAEALLDAYRITGQRSYLQYGQRTLDELLMTQASWQPPFIYVDAIGGFGVMNYDADWIDARQSLFAELIVNYGKTLNVKEYIQRGLAAMRASFLMIYSPENTKTKLQWEAKWPFFNATDYGFMMENYGHEGKPTPAGGGIGEFSIFSWGSGAAAEGYNRMLDRYGKALLELSD